MVIRGHRHVDDGQDHEDVRLQRDDQDVEDGPHGAGDDVALLGTGDDKFVWNPGDGSDIVEGQDGNDTLQFNGANVNENISVAANGSRVLLGRDVGNITMDLNGIEDIQINAAGGGDHLVVNDLSGTGVAQVAFPLAQATPDNKRRAADAVKGLKADGGTAMSTWLRVAREQFRKKPGAIHHALLLTDGRNEGEPEQKLTTALHECEGEFQCDARGRHGNGKA